MATVRALRQQQHGKRGGTAVRAGGLLREEQRAGQLGDVGVEFDSSSVGILWRPVNSWSVVRKM